MRVLYSAPEEYELVAQRWYPRRRSCLERGPRKKVITARLGSCFRSCLRKRRFHRPSWLKVHLQKLGFGLGQELTTIGAQT